MGKPILYYILLSPPSRAVLLTAKAIGLDLELKEINLLTGDHLTPEFIKINPTHTVPTLDDNGVHIFDSHAIMCYLVDKYATDDSLYPKDLIERTHVNERLYFDTGYLFCRLSFLFGPILDYGSPDVPQDKLDYIEKTYELLEEILNQNNKYVVRNTLTIGDFACISSISSSEIAVPVDGAKYPKVLAWINRLKELPYYQELNQKGVDDLGALYREALKKNKEAAAGK